MCSNIVAAWQLHIPSYTTGGQYGSNDLLHPRRSVLSECFCCFFSFFRGFFFFLGGGRGWEVGRGESGMLMIW